MKRLPFSLVLLSLIITSIAGCVSNTGVPSTQPSLVTQNIDLVVDATEAFAAIVATPKQYDQIVVYAEKLRNLNDLPAVQALLKQLQTGNTTVPAATTAK